ncbi:bifunctional 2-C-methyl-D-erythritol 4-phosphate cytidylyltransferase/2-C-methyl-D-erythritol 2,4-cyclodiphosphate synthase [Sphingomonas sp.]|jgi:2-C-methyl-D-erythritol 4-phosphate cytidylyltransferase/2-C-methyl-D-erythritol 2,4-cyclodiphosphate synthase|uniref:bifunctional 2-C-methyl-D-erythritol 4-phosphate cytidylyltransferase/2-C-methyl-D-erythritol 2,4-cyclodiphosphate synthase n=1 Tax=Sphingomonas sp. TaxID=28214 RepID=UPI002ED82062
MSRRIVAILVAAGNGTRAGGTRPKQFATLAGRPMVAHSYEALVCHPAIRKTIVVADPALAAEMLPGASIVAGGATRRESVARGLDTATTAGATHVLVHDAARPFLAATVIDAVVAALDTHDGAIPVLPVADTLAFGCDMLGDTVDRAALVRVQTPQGFRIDILQAAHAGWPPELEATDDAQMVRRLGGRIALVQGDAMLEKVTYPEDFAAAEARLAMETRTAMGFDVHRLEAGVELWLGGVLIPHDKGLSGHSDADVALHALTDALLGTIAAGDIGTHFPPSDPQWKGADSARFLRHAADLIAARGGRIDFVDLTIVCEAPKIGPHRAAMTARIADLLALSPDRVSVKATTTERLGFTGRGEGIAAQAVATVRVPR